MEHIDFFGRNDELETLNSFWEQKGSGFTYMRGRRRIGKSWLLKHFQAKHKNCFYYMGRPDETKEEIFIDFVKKWVLFSKETLLEDLRPELISWSRIFSEILKYAEKQKEPLILLFDEIQWIAKKGAGFIGSIKEAWIDWEMSGKIKVIICGSSNKFFSKYVGGEEKILRGIRTFNDITVKPFTLKETKDYYLKNFSNEEICLTYMMLGGCPYYLSTLNPSLGFIQAINSTIFTNKTIFLKEIYEILNLEFNKNGAMSATKILSSLGQDGKTVANIVKLTGLNPTVVLRTVKNLLEYDLIEEKNFFGEKQKRNNAGTSYIVKDFFLNFYFQIVLPLKSRIEMNEQGLLFPQYCIKSKKGFYIENFSGKAFEKLISYILSCKFYSLKKAPNIFKKLLLNDVDFTVGTYSNQDVQIDIVVENKSDRIVRLIECKWLSNTDFSLENVCKKLSLCNYPKPKGFIKKYYLALSQDVTSNMLEVAKKYDVELIGLEDLF
ncbi:MAG: AAA family ATPase [Endomicrobium sp.]|jgi:AAA+ ATPase superfamily predicted ATPase|uniref:ATP-binding protein n=1 Tax=Candidatus Endomicrobiellum cubanum TaxID=3242325 RepID=UPI002839E578|nr:AAA family ATPase [Endomicrobium sp.]